MSIPKPLKGGQRNRGGEIELDQLRVTDDIIIQDVPIGDIISGDFVFDPIDIDSGTIDGVIIGNDQPGPSFFTNITSGTEDGSGFDITFYGINPGDQFLWDASLGKLVIDGDLCVTGCSEFGNIQIKDNTISTTNTDGDIILNPNGGGGIVINGPIVGTAEDGSITFDVEGFFTINSGLSINYNSGDDINFAATNDYSNTTINGDLSFFTEIGHRLCITNISVGTGSVLVTTKTKHYLKTLSTITLNHTNSVPSIDGTHQVNSITDDFTFEISSLTTTVAGSKGQIRRNHDITNISITAGSFLTVTTLYDHYLQPGNTIDFLGTNSTPSLDGTHTVHDVPSLNIFRLAFLTTSTGNTGTVTKQLDNQFFINSYHINIIGENSVKIESDDITLNSRLLEIGPDTSFCGPDFTADDNKDRGILMNYHNGVSLVQAFTGYDDSTGCWTFIPEATVSNGVVSGDPGCIRVFGIDGGGGSITNIDTIDGIINMNGDPDLILSATNDIFLNATNNVNIAHNVGLTFGADCNKIESNGTDLCIDSCNNLKLTPAAGNDIVIPSNIGIVLDGNVSGTSTQTIESDGTDITINIYRH